MQPSASARHFAGQRHNENVRRLEELQDEEMQHSYEQHDFRCFAKAARSCARVSAVAVLSRPSSCSRRSSGGPA